MRHALFYFFVFVAVVFVWYLSSARITDDDDDQKIQSHVSVNAVQKISCAQLSQSDAEISKDSLVLTSKVVVEVATTTTAQPETVVTYKIDTAAHDAIVSMKEVEIESIVVSPEIEQPIDAQPLKNTKQAQKKIEPVDLEEVCIEMPSSDLLMYRLKKSGFGGLAANKKFIDKLAGKTLSAAQVYDLACQELDSFKDKWVAKQRKGKLCNALFQNYPTHVAYLKECEKIEDNPKIYWKTAKLYAEKLKNKV